PVRATRWWPTLPPVRFGGGDEETYRRLSERVKLYMDELHGVQEATRLVPIRSRHALARQARRCRPHRAGHRLPGRGPGYPRYGTGVRGRCEYGAAVAGRSGGATPGLLAALSV